MTNKIIEAAREAGAGVGTSGRWIATQRELERFYAIARAEALEDAARECERMIVGINEERDWARGDCAKNIRALKEQQHG